MGRAPSQPARLGERGATGLLRQRGVPPGELLRWPRHVPVDVERGIHGRERGGKAAPLRVPSAQSLGSHLLYRHGFQPNPKGAQAYAASVTKILEPALPAAR
jgi:hypothetical protein